MTGMTEPDAVSRAKIMFPAIRTVDTNGVVWVEEGWAQVRNGLFAVGVRKFDANSPESPMFVLRGFGGNWEDAFRMARIGVSKSKGVHQHEKA